MKFTVLDAVELGYHTHLIEDGCRGVNLNAGDVDAAIRQVVDAGATVISSQQILTSTPSALRKAHN